MKVYCQIQNNQVPSEKMNICVSNSESPQLLALTERSISTSGQERYQTDDDMRHGLELLKGTRLFHFNKIYKGRLKGRDLYNDVFRSSLERLYKGNDCLILHTVVNCR